MHFFQVLTLLLLSIVPGLAAAETFRCTTNGRIYYSDRPCPVEPKLQAVGPRGTAYQAYVPPPPGAPRADEHLKYLSAECAGISEAIRTAPARGVRNSETLRGLHDEYQQKCAFDDREAWQHVQQDRSQQMRQHEAEKSAAVAERRQANDRQDRCAAMRDIIGVKRKREAQMQPPEVEALRSLEKTYNETCLAR
jgi:hypothetical protein